MKTHTILKPATLSVLPFLALFFIIDTVHINDISNINLTSVTRIEYPTTLQELTHIVETAKKEGLKLSMAGKRHSQGGHTFYADNVVIDINKLTKIVHLDTAKKIITVEPGVTWQQIQLLCNHHNLALKVTQTANIFTIGGSLSVNCHGRDPHYGPLIETIQSFRILLADGTLVNASRTENKELFTLAIGGYGLFGIITEVDILLTTNDVYKKNSKIVAMQDYLSFVKKNIILNQNVGLHYGHIILNGDKVITTTYIKTSQYNKKAFYIDTNPDILLGKWSLKMRRKYDAFNSLSSYVELPALALREALPQTTCRNNAMQHPVEFLENTSTTTTDLLGSYFIPLNTLPDFIRNFKKLIAHNNIKSIYVLIRYIPQDTESFLRYASQNCFEIVIFTNVEQSAKQIAHAQKWTRQLINIVLDLNGCYYLPTPLFATDEQLKRAYPMIDDFFAKKRQYDPQELFINNFYKRYAVFTDY